MPDANDPLARTRPLANPLRIITLLAMAGALVLAIVVSAIYIPQIGAFAILIALSPALVIFSFAVIAGRTGKPNAIYLRAFRTDRSTATLRGQIGAILGPKFILSGIRPPREKSSVFLRFLIPGVIAFRYAGSKFMQLEAGDDWMARLWKTYQSTRVVFIDVREMTSHVHNEIQMTLATVGLERILFVVGPGRSADEWRRTIAEIAGPEANPARFQLLDASPERVRSRQMAEDLKMLVAALPPGTPGATDHGRQFVLDHVSPQQMEAGRRVSLTTAASAIVALAISLGVGFLPMRVQGIIALPAGVLSLIVVALAVGRGFGRVARLARYGHGGAAAGAACFLVFAVILFAAGAVFPMVAIPNLINSRQEAQEISAMQSLRAIDQAEIMYSTSYPDRGYACRLSQLGGPATGTPTADAAQLIQPDLAAGEKAGYHFSLSCTRTTTQGKSVATGFTATAVPDPSSNGGRRGFCADDSGEIRQDRNGGTNCTEPLP